MDARAEFFTRVQRMQRPRILEFGTRRSKPSLCTSHKEELLRLNPDAVHTGTDLRPGIDVDVVADAHRLSSVFRAAEFDGFISASVFEHLRWPWVAIMELNHVIRLGGLGYVQTHHTFPVHDHPNDYWRFSTEALATLFCDDLGWRVLKSDYDFPCEIVPPARVAEWNPAAHAYLNVNVTVEKVGEVDRDRYRWPVD
jgi:hypothetical protein